MRGMMRQGSIVGGGTMGQGDWRRFRHGVVRVVASANSVSRGTVSLIVDNTGYLTHELVVLPLAAGQKAATRTPAQMGPLTRPAVSAKHRPPAQRVPATALRPARSAGSRSPFRPAGTRWCNLPGHHAAGMYTALDIT